MTTIQEKIQAASARNVELLSTLKETDHAEPDLENHNKYIADLDSQLNQSAKRTWTLDRRREKELKEHEKYRDSVMRRFAYKATGRAEKFAQKAEKEEREYFEALQESHREAQSRAAIEDMLRDAHAVKAELEAAAARHRDAQRDIDGLYDSIFQGPTPDFPDEDEREREAQEALQVYHDARVRAEGEAAAGRMLRQAQAHMRDAERRMGEALDASTYDMFGGGAWADAMERNALHKAELCVRDARMKVANAGRASRNVDARSLPDARIAEGSIISDVFFDNIFTDMQFHEKIKDSMIEVKRLHAAIDRLAAECKQRADELSADLREKEVLLESTRVTLQDTRARVFQQLSQNKVPTTPPPPFTE